VEFVYALSVVLHVQLFKVKFVYALSVVLHVQLFEVKICVRTQAQQETKTPQDTVAHVKGATRNGVI
jgi:hypothetical protein